MKLFLVGDVLDVQVVDMKGRKVGRIDGIVIETRDGMPPRVTHIEISPITLLGRFGRRIATRYARLDRRFGAERGQPIRVPWEHVHQEALAFRLDFVADDTPLTAVERWLRAHVIGRLPGS